MFVWSTIFKKCSGCLHKPLVIESLKHVFVYQFDLIPAGSFHLTLDKENEINCFVPTDV